MLKFFFENPFTTCRGVTGSPVSRLTWSGRFEALDGELAQLLDRRCLILDVAVSSGETTLDLFLVLKKSGQYFQLSMCDPWSKVFIRRGLITSIRNEFGGFILHRVGPLVFSRNLRWIWALSKVSGMLLNKALQQRDWGDKHSLLRPEVETRLVNREFSWISWDAFQGPTETRYDVIRVMNLLNEKLFSRIKIERAVANAHASLTEQGILLIGQTDHQGVTAATFFRKDDKGFREVKAVNGGTKLANLISSFSCDNRN